MTTSHRARRCLHRLGSHWGLRVFAALLALLPVCTKVRAQGVSLSEPLSAPIGAPIYSESELTGPSSSLVPGDNNLTNPYIRTGISDPLGFLIESTLMTPYAPEQALAYSYPDADVHSDLVNDSTVAARFSEYRDNRLLMSGAGASALRSGRAVAAGTLSRQAGASAGGAASSASSRVGVLAPFAAGSSALAAQQSAVANPGFIDPNAMVAALTSSAALGGVSSMTADTANPGATSANDTGTVAAGVPDPNADTMSISLSAIPLGAMVPPATSQPYGPSPGELFPNVSFATQSATGFQDSTMGTADLPVERAESDTSPLLSPRADSTSGPFTDVSSEQAEFLNPTLLTGADMDETGIESTVPLSELKRQARLHAMINNPGTPLPSPFEERAMEKAYLQQLHGHHQRRTPRLLAPSVTP